MRRGWQEVGGGRVFRPTTSVTAAAKARATAPIIMFFFSLEISEVVFKERIYYFDPGSTISLLMTRNGCKYAYLIMLLHVLGIYLT